MTIKYYIAHWTKWNLLIYCNSAIMYVLMVNCIPHLHLLLRKLTLLIFCRHEGHSVIRNSFQLEHIFGFSPKKRENNLSNEQYFLGQLRRRKDPTRFRLSKTTEIGCSQRSSRSQFRAHRYRGCSDSSDTRIQLRRGGTW